MNRGDIRRVFKLVLVGALFSGLLSTGVLSAWHAHGGDTHHAECSICKVAGGFVASIPEAAALAVEAAEIAAANSLPPLVPVTSYLCRSQLARGPPFQSTH